jgi:paraquat-inducible protein A
VALNKDVITCHECALRVKLPQLNELQKAMCPRCGFVLTRKHINAIERVIAFSVTAIIFLLISLPFNFLSFSAKGLVSKIDVSQSFDILIKNNYQILALIEFITIYAIPSSILLALLYLLVPLRKGRYPPNGHKVMSLLFKLIPWSMVEIFLVGTFVSLIKMNSMADVIMGPSFFAFFLFSMTMTATLLHVDKHQFYVLLDAARKNSKLPLEQKSPSKAINRSLSIQKTWALIITSIILYIPANMLPIMNTRLFGQDDPTTILGGVILLWQMGSIPIAMVIFVASVAVPVAKILVLAWLNLSVQKNSSAMTKERMKLYRIAEFVGRWSMVDVYVVIILVSLIQLGNTMSIYPGAATLAFSGVVILTMLAAMTFEPQLIWNIHHKQKIQTITTASNGKV